MLGRDKDQDLLQQCQQKVGGVIMLFLWKDIISFASFRLGSLFHYLQPTAKEEEK